MNASSYLKKFTKRNPYKSLPFQSRLCHLIGDMLMNGFSLVEIFQFFEKLSKDEASLGKNLLKEMKVGRSIPESFAQLGFPPYLVLQLEMAEVHGELAATFKKMGTFIDLKMQQQKALKKALLYPSLLLGFVLGFMVTLKYAILPQLQTIGSFQEASLLQSLLEIPFYLGILTFVFLLFFIIFKGYFTKQNPRKKAAFFSRFPFIGDLYRMYVTAVISGEFGKLFALGIDLKEVYLILTQQKASRLLQELGKEGLKAGKNGEDLKSAMEKEPYLQPEFTLMIQTGELKGKLSDELVYYSQLLWQEFVSKVQKKMQYLQPLAFFVVAILIVLLYASLLLPIYNQTWEVM